jgi:microtubule-associated protein-like 1/2
VKFSPDGTLLAVGCHDDCLYLFDVDPKKPDKQVIQQRAVLFGHESEVSSFDFNTDSTLLRSIGEAGELRYWDIKTH